jgi:hypothetical protein
VNKNRHITDINPIDIETLFDAAQRHQIENPELCQEREIRATLRLSDKAEQTIYESFQNTTLTVSKDSRKQQIQLQSVDLSPFLSFIERGELSEITHSFNAPPPPNPISFPLSELIVLTRESLLHRTLYKSLAESFVGPIQAEITLSHHFFEAHYEKEHFSKEETQAKITVNWQWQKEGNTSTFTLSESRHSYAELFQLLKSGELREEIIKSLESPSLWPVPEGKHNILWTEKTFAELLLPFLRAFESDSFLENPNYLGSPEAVLPRTLLIEEKPEPSQVDFEGALRKASPLLAMGKIKGLACTKSTAALMQVNSTGHSRKNFFTDQKIPGFFNLQITGVHSEPDILSSLESGIQADKIQWVKFNPQTFSGEIDILRARLVHQGKLGESLTPFRLSGWDLQHSEDRLYTSP